jgi:hypothetical protein
VAEFGVETVLTALPVFLAQSSTLCLQISYFLPSALREIEISTAEALVEGEKTGGQGERGEQTQHGFPPTASGFIA